MENNSFGTVTFTVSERHDQIQLITDEEAHEISAGLAKYLQFLLHERSLDEYIEVSGISWTRGCITIVIGFTIVGAAAGGAAIFKTIKGYKEVKEGLKQICNDLKNLGVWIKTKFKKKQSAPAKQQSLTIEKNDEDPFRVMFELALKDYQSKDPEHRKYWAAGQTITIMNDKGEYHRFQLALKREDIKDPKELIS